MSANLTRQIAAAATAVVAAATAVIVQAVAGSLGAALIALIGGLVAGGVALVLLGRDGSDTPQTAGAAATAPHPDAGTDRATLIATSLYLRDRLTSAALTDRLDRDLASVGVLPVTPVGERFDPSLHSAEGGTPTSDEHLVGTIAVVDAPGYADRGVLLRPPTVTVYQPAPTDVPRTKKATS